MFYSCFTEKPAVVVTNIPSFSTDLNPELIEEEKKKAKETRRQSVITGLIKAESQKAKWRKPELDKSYEDELRRQELAEERRKRQMEMLERIRNRKMDELALQEDDGSPHFEDCKYCKFSLGLLIRETSHMRSFVKIKPSRNGEITLSFTDIWESYPSHEIVTLQKCLLTLFAKTKFSRKFPKFTVP